MTNENQSQWYDLLKDYYNTPLTDVEADRWYADIRRKYHFANNETICNAIVWASKNYRKEVRRATVPDILLWIRLAAISKPVEHSHVACKPCNDSGWVVLNKGVSDGNFTFQEYFDGEQIIIPCACSLGRAVFNSNNMYWHCDESKQLEVAKFAVRQRLEFYRVGDALPPFDRNKPYSLTVGNDLPYDKKENVAEIECPF